VIILNLRRRLATVRAFSIRPDNCIGAARTKAFLQITQDHDEDPLIPGASYGFATLNHAQYLGDYESLQNRDRRLIRVHLHGDPDTTINVLRQSLAEAAAAS
jgi:hypothetical protein